MENASDALKMAFAVLMFVVALSLAFSSLTKARETTDAVLWFSDKTNYYDWEAGSLQNGRVVSEETVISALCNFESSNTRVIIERDGIITEFKPIETDETVKENFIKTLNQGHEYLENIMEITVGGKYKVAEDGTKIIQNPVETIIQVRFTKI